MFTITEVQQVLHGEQGQSINSYNKNISGFDSGIFFCWSGRVNYFRFWEILPIIIEQKADYGYNKNDNKI